MNGFFSLFSKNVRSIELENRAKTCGARAACATGFGVLYLVAPTYLAFSSTIFDGAALLRHQKSGS
jgi:hypothetical protein